MAQVADEAALLATAASADSAGDARRRSEPWAVTLKGLKEPVEVVRIEWR